ncbi:hypothetical protein G9A89_006000 [Geosiphon pyriformis]|nr:hypothetical protein G9A89_006000 [Geosiphon pyriformis]
MPYSNKKYRYITVPAVTRSVAQKLKQSGNTTTQTSLQATGHPGSPIKTEAEETTQTKMQVQSSFEKTKETNNRKMFTNEPSHVNNPETKRQRGRPKKHDLATNTEPQKTNINSQQSNVKIIMINKTTEDPSAEDNTDSNIKPPAKRRNFTITKLEETLANTETMLHSVLDKDHLDQSSQPPENNSKIIVKRGRPKKQKANADQVSVNNVQEKVFESTATKELAQPLESRSKTTVQRGRPKKQKADPDQASGNNGQEKVAESTTIKESAQLPESQSKPTVKRGRPKKQKVDVAQISTKSTQEKASDSIETKGRLKKNVKEISAQDEIIITTPTVPNSQDRKVEQLSFKVNEIPTMGVDQSVKPQNQIDQDLATSAMISSRKRKQNQDEGILESTSEVYLNHTFEIQSNTPSEKNPKGTARGRTKRQKREGTPVEKKIPISAQTNPDANISTAKNSKRDGSTTNNSVQGSSCDIGRKRKQKDHDNQSPNFDASGNYKTTKDDFTGPSKRTKFEYIEETIPGYDYDAQDFINSIYDEEEAKDAANILFSMSLV